MDPTDLVRFLRAAKSQGYDSGEYVFINALPYNKGPYQFENGKTKNPGGRKLCRVNLKAGKAAALGHTWSGATHAPRKEKKRRKKTKKKNLEESNF